MVIAKMRNEVKALRLRVALARLVKALQLLTIVLNSLPQLTDLLTMTSKLTASYLIYRIFERAKTIDK